jgi:hypothetical protein
MKIKFENQSKVKLSKRVINNIEHIIDSLPRDHIRGVERLQIVDLITDPRVKAIASESRLPGLYHPRQGSQPAWMEIALAVLLPQDQPIYKRLVSKLSFKGNMAAIIFSLVGQHYYLTLRHSVRKTQIEGLVRSYTEKQLKAWNQQQTKGIRGRVLRPLQPTLERWGRSLQKRASANKKRLPKSQNT